MMYFACVNSKNHIERSFMISLPHSRSTVLEHDLPRGSHADVIEASELIFESIELTARKVTSRHPLQVKPNAKDKERNTLLSLPNRDAGFHAKYSSLTEDIAWHKIDRATKRIHVSLVAGWGVKRALAAYTNICNPPIALVSKEGKVADTPLETCKVISQNLANLGGPPDYEVLTATQEFFLGEVKPWEL